MDIEKKFELIKRNTYEIIEESELKELLKDNKNLEFVRGSDFQLKKDYIFDVMRLSTHVSVKDATKAASEVVKSVEGEKAKLSGLLYPLMQSLDEEYLKTDAQLGGTDQRKIMVLARENLPKLGYKSRIEVMHALIPGLVSGKMSSSDEGSKIDLLDGPETIKRKLKNAEMVEGDPNNGVMAFLKYVIMIIKQDQKKFFFIERDEKYGGDLKYKTYEEIEKDFVAKKLHPLDLKNAVAAEISGMLNPIQTKRKELEKIAKDAYNN